MRIRLTQIDGKLPNLALMKLAHYHRDARRRDPFHQGCRARSARARIRSRLWLGDLLVQRAARGARFAPSFPTRSSAAPTTSPTTRPSSRCSVSSEYEHYDYSIYPKFDGSIGFTQRGCRLKCGFCVVPKKEGKSALGQHDRRHLAWRSLAAASASARQRFLRSAARAMAGAGRGDHRRQVQGLPQPGHQHPHDRRRVSAGAQGHGLLGRQLQDPAAVYRMGQHRRRGALLRWRRDAGNATASRHRICWSTCWSATTSARPGNGCCIASAHGRARHPALPDGVWRQEALDPVRRPEAG